MKNYLNPPQVSDRVSIAILILRLGFGLLLIPHGYSKLQNFMAGNHDFPDPLHISPILSQGLTIFAEFFCAILLVLGLFFRPVSMILLVLMIVIAFVIHWSDPIDVKETALLYLTTFLAIHLTGAGKYSLDARLFG